MNYQIRPYHHDDLDGLVQIFRLNTPKYFDASEEAELIDYLTHHAMNYYVIQFGTILIGAGGYNLQNNDKTGAISWYFFHPEYQGMGLGTAIVQKSLGELKELSTIQKIIVRTSQFAFKFFEKQGFSLVRVEKDYWAPGIDMYFMQYAQMTNSSNQ